MARSDILRLRARLASLALALLVSVPTVLIVAQPAAAQSGPDLAVTRLDYGDPVVGKETAVKATITNVGTGSVGGSGTVIEVRFFWNESGGYTNVLGPPGTNAHWLNRNTNQQTGVGSKITFTESFNAGQSRVAEIAWTPEENWPLDGPQAGRGRIIIHIIAFNPTSPTGNPDSNAANNDPSYDVNVKFPRFKLTKLWTNIYDLAQIKKRCEPASAPPMQVSCKVMPGALTTYEFEIQNRGNFRDTFEMYFEDVVSSPGATPSLAHWNVTLSPSSPVLDAGERTNIIVLIQSARTGNRATADWAINPVEGGPTVFLRVNSTTNDVVQEELAFPTMKVDQFYSINMTYVKDANQLYEINHFGNVTRPITWNFSLNNNGNGLDTVNVSIDFAESEIGANARAWNATINGFEVGDEPAGYVIESNIVAGRSIPMTLTVTPPEATRKDEFTIRVNARSTKDLLGEAASADSDEFRAIVYQTFALEKRLDIPVQQVRAAEIAKYPLYISNNGNGPDPVTLKLENIPSGWTARIDKTRVTIPAYSTALVNLTVTSPIAERENKFADVFVNVTSSGPLDRNRNPVEESRRVNVSFRTHTEIRPGPNLVLTADPSTLSGFVDPGKTRSFDVRVKNVGNRWDNVTFSFERQPLEWGASASVGTTEVTLPPRAEKLVTVTVTAPTLADLGQIGKIGLIANSEDRTETERVDFTGKISGPDLYVGGITVSRVPVYQGDNVTVDVSLGNKGNKQPVANGLPLNSTLRVSYVQGGTARQIGPALTVSDLFGSSAQTLSVPWDTTNVEPGPGVLTATIDPENLIPEIEEVNGNSITLGGEAAFVRTFNLAVEPASSFTARPGEVVNVPNAFRVRNLGNAAEPVSVSLASGRGWASLRQDPFTLTPGEERVFPLTVSIPARPGVGNDTIAFKLEPTLRPGRALTASIAVAVRDDAPPTIRNARATPGDVNLGGRIVFSAEIVDAVGVKTARLVVKDPLNATQDLPLVKGAGDVWSAERTWSVVGLHQYYVEATDASAIGNTNSTRLAPGSFRVSPGSAPKITVLTDLRNPIRSGTPIALDITDPLGIARAWYVLGAEETELPRTWRLATDDFSTGPVELTVIAENVYGVRTSTTFGVEFDNTPPEILKTTLDPARPKAGESLTVRIQTAASVEAVDVVVKRGGETVETLSATRVGTGLFTVKYTPSAGNYDFDVVAKDAAGNTNLERGVVSAKIGGGLFGVPGPGVLLALAAVGIAIAARRRT